MPVIGWSTSTSLWCSLATEALKNICQNHAVDMELPLVSAFHENPRDMKHIYIYTYNPCITLLLLLLSLSLSRSLSLSLSLSVSLSSKPSGRSLHSPLVQCLKSSFSQSIHIKTWDSALSCSHLKQLRQCVPLTKIHKESAPVRNISQFRFAMWIHRYFCCPEVSMNLHDIKWLVVEYLHPPIEMDKKTIHINPH